MIPSVTFICPPSDTPQGLGRGYFFPYADEIRGIAHEQDRWIKMACAFPVSPVVTNRRGINGTDWIPIDRATYDACLDSRDYRPKSLPPEK